jgi:translation initiation factor 1 (eIF-1/SUI1)
MANLVICHMVTMLDEDLVVRAKVRQRFVKGPVPLVDILGEKLMNKKVTTIIGLELYRIELTELKHHLKVSCACSVNLMEHKDSTPKSPKFIVCVQGNMVKQLEEILIEKYKIPKKYIKCLDLIPGKKKRGFKPK